ncbi:hydrogenase iron-sulfur subunit [Ammonifex thiophilus]|uniref:Hydrogenase iron-sulfur subunit n=1 Tax=Ammonifex thiophilus TaxID=444093 RepID=A0A3D8P6A3_9THEO|nr:hydrogenase iron-sulfur subunit [Ammonifex thiophilus]RDV84870.1 hydrogenase iron-sulfur subunit [Ammonifex thiophilus]
MKEFEPIIVAFCCHYCAYAAADLAGSLRLEYPPGIRIVEVPCSGRVEEELILKAFAEGADGVLVAGCLEGDCHFQKGNIRARKRVEHLRQLLKEIGLEPERLAMYHLSSAMGRRFAEIAWEMAEKVAGLGPSPLRRRTREG